MGNISLAHGKSAPGSIFFYSEPKNHLFKSCPMKGEVISSTDLMSRVRICSQKHYMETPGGPPWEFEVQANFKYCNLA